MAGLISIVPNLTSSVIGMAALLHDSMISPAG
jgi:hypothetical protein